MLLLVDSNTALASSITPGFSPGNTELNEKDFNPNPHAEARGK